MKKELFFKQLQQESTHQDMPEFKAKLLTLRERWKKRNDSEGRRLVFKILKQAEIPDSLIKSIIEDDFVSFDKAKSDANNQLVYFFEAACLCGASTIVESFLKKYDFNILHSDNAIAYALSSGNFVLAESLAKLAIEAGQTSPGEIYLYNSCQLSQLKQIENLFASLSQKQTADI